jgi:Flp pilus assembly protein TadG
MQSTRSIFHIKRTEQGVTMVFVAISLVGMLAASAFALDLGQDYTNRRQMQNAADAAALAGTRALMKTRNTTTGLYSDVTNSVFTSARDTAASNGADSTQLTCKVVRRDTTVISDCSLPAVWTIDSPGPAGVLVTTAVTTKTAFGRVLGQSSLTARASATGMVEPLATSKGAPFIVCGIGDTTKSLAQWDKDTSVVNGLTVQNNHDAAPLPINVLNANGTINSLAVGHIYGVQGSNATISTCGTESAFDGKSANGNTGITLPSWQTGTNGNGNDAAIYDTVAGAAACVPPNFTNCDLVLPIADAGAPGYQLHVVALGLFHVSGDGTGNPKYAARLWVATAPVTKGQGGSGYCSLAQACVIKLVS